MERRLRNPYWLLNHDPARSYVRLTRTGSPFASITDLDASVAEIGLVLDALGREANVILVDLRNGPMRTDHAFERAMKAARARLLAGFRSIAVVVRTPLGAMQLSRHQREGAIAWMTFNDEAAAMSHLGILMASSGTGGS